MGREGESEWQAGFQSGAFDSASTNTFQLQPVDGCVQKGAKRLGRGFVIPELAAEEERYFALSTLSESFSKSALHLLKHHLK